METTDRPQIHYTELPDVAPGSKHRAEWDCYRREVERLLAAGNEEKFVLIKDDAIIGIWESKDDAMNEGYRRYQLQGFLVQQIRTWEPVLRQRITYY
jgi:hypothetical protein